MIFRLVPAYGRDYRSKKEIEGALSQDLDFKISDVSSPSDGRYINLTQMTEAGCITVIVRYAKLARVCVIELKTLKP